jgi:hypothetical protein
VKIIVFLKGSSSAMEILLVMPRETMR